MQRIERILEQEIHQLESNIKFLEKRMEKSPEGRLQIGHCKGCVQYYCFSEKSETTKRHGKYIKKENMILAEQLAQKDYDKRLLQQLKEKYRKIKKAYEIYEKADCSDVYENLHADRKKLVKPLYISNEEYAKRWQEVTYQKKPFQEGVAEIYTVKGERVRSKSEKILADTFEREGIPYRYEAPVILPKSGNRIIHPDFSLLNVRTRSEYYLEHLGKMDDPEYAANAVRRIEDMGKNGIILGKNLLLTAETMNCPLDIRYVYALIRENLL